MDDEQLRSQRRRAVGTLVIWISVVINVRSMDGYGSKLAGRGERWTMSRTPDDKSGTETLAAHHRSTLKLWVFFVSVTSLGLFARFAFRHGGLRDFPSVPYFIGVVAVLLVGVFVIHRMRRADLDEAARERALAERLPRGTHGMVHTFAIKLPTKQAEQLAAALDGMPPHRATSELLPYLLDRRARHVVADAPMNAWHLALEVRLSLVREATPQGELDASYRDGSNAPDESTHQVVVYVLAALHGTRPTSEIPTDATELTAWLDALVPLRPDESATGVGRSRSLSQASCDALLQSVSQTATRTPRQVAAKRR